MAVQSPAKVAAKLLRIIEKDREHLERIDAYIRGDHDLPFTPNGIPQDGEYELLQRRSIDNWIPLIVSASKQVLYVDGFRVGASRDEAGESGDYDPLAEDHTNSDEWAQFQRSRMDARQGAVYHSAIGYGHAFTVTEANRKGLPVSKVLSTLNTSAVFEDPVNDEDPVAALTIRAEPALDDGMKVVESGKATMWDDTYVYEVRFDSRVDAKSVRAKVLRKHGNSVCPVTRFVADIDSEGRTTGVVAPSITSQDRLNQTTFDLLLAQTYTSVQVRTVTGMAPPMRYEYRDGEGNLVTDPRRYGDPDVDRTPAYDADGEPIPAAVHHNASRMLFAEDPDTEFGTLPGAPLNGFLDARADAIRSLAATTQTPPDYLLGQIANLSAEALRAAQTNLSRKVALYRSNFGESWERNFRLGAELQGNERAMTDLSGEVIWRDMEARSLAQEMDGLSKGVEGLGIPAQGLWHRFPGATKNEVRHWMKLADADQGVDQFYLDTQRALGDRSALRGGLPGAPRAREVEAA